MSVTYERAKEIIYEDRSYLDDDGEALGIAFLYNIMKNHNIEDRYICAEHDQIWYGDFKKTIAVMNETDVAQMSKWGWFEAEDSWTTFV